MRKDKNEQEELIILDELGNEIVVELEVTIPALLAWEYGAFIEDAHDLKDFKVRKKDGKKNKNTIR